MDRTPVFPAMLMKGITGLRPWPFQHKNLEAKYQEYVLLSLIDRSRRILASLFIISWISRFTLLAFCVAFPCDRTMQEMALIGVRMILLSLASVALYFEWNEATKIRLAQCVIWIFRLGYLAACAEQPVLNMI